MESRRVWVRVSEPPPEARTCSRTATTGCRRSGRLAGVGEEVVEGVAAAGAEADERAAARAQVADAVMAAVIGY
jgi:hypothetical protein